jgi:SAM-dependent methyltransferase
MAGPPHSATDLEQIYERRFAGQDEGRYRIWSVLTGSFFNRWIPPNAAVLDLGCGYCEFINQVAAAKKFAMDLNPQAHQRAQGGIQVLLQDCSQSWHVDRGSLDVVFTSNFFEHLETRAQLESTLREVFRCLKPGGALLALGPNIRYLPGTYWDFFDHYLALTHLSLAEVLEKAGFQIEVNIDRFLPYTMSQGRTYPSWALKAYLAFPFAWRFFGKQFFLVARKPSEPGSRRG